MDRNRIVEIVAEHASVVSSFFETSADDIVAIGQRLARCLRDGGKLLLLGNGGSAADAQHIAAEMVCRFQLERRPLPAIALTTDTSALTAIGNDYGAEFIFARQVEALGKEGDVVIAISTSGNSQNVLEALRVARTRGLTTVGLLGRDGGPALGHVDLPLVVGSQKTARIQEVHSIIGHMLCEAIETELFGS